MYIQVNIWKLVQTEDLNLVNSCLSDGSMGMMKTKEEYQRRGFGTLLLRRMVQESVKLGLVPFVHIEDGNVLSQKMFAKLGFKRGDQASWVNYNP